MNKGNITQHDLFTIMPFQNIAIVVKLNGNKILELLEYLNLENIAHPISGISIEFNQNEIKAIINGKDFNINKSYYVFISFFLLKFIKKNSDAFLLNLKSLFVRFLILSLFNAVPSVKFKCIPNQLF